VSGPASLLRLFLDSKRETEGVCVCVCVCVHGKFAPVPLRHFLSFVCVRETFILHTKRSGARSLKALSVGVRRTVMTHSLLGPATVIAPTSDTHSLCCNQQGDTATVAQSRATAVLIPPSFIRQQLLYHYFTHLLAYGTGPG
jgi:hypothetical protein